MEGMDLVEENSLRIRNDLKRKSKKNKNKTSQMDNEKEKTKKKYDNYHLKYYCEGFSSVLGELELVRLARPLAVTELNLQLFRRTSEFNILECFNKVTCQEIWDHLAEQTNIEMDRKYRMKEISDSQYTKYYKKKVTNKEIINIFALRHYLDSFVEERKMSQKFVNNLPAGINMSYSRYCAITSSMTCNWKIFCGFLRNSWSNAISQCFNFTIDEAIFAFASSTDPTCPKRYIPRKPNPNGLLVYLATTKLLGKFPFSFDIEPDVDHKKKLNPRSALLAMVERFKWDHLNPIVALDAGFSGDETLKILNDKKFFYVASVNIAHKRWLHDLLEMYAPQGSWIATSDRNKVIWSLKRNEEKNFFLATNCFKPTKAHSRMTEELPISTDDFRVLSKLSKRALTSLCSKLGVSFNDANIPLSEVIGNFINDEHKNKNSSGKRKKDTESEEEDIHDSESSPSASLQTNNIIQEEENYDDKDYYEKSNVEELEWAIEDEEEESGLGYSSELDNVEVETNLSEREVVGNEVNEEMGGRIEVYDKYYNREQLEGLKVAEIQEIASKRGIPRTGTKAILINKILETQEINEEEYDHLMDDLMNSANQTMAPHHTVYRNLFNGVDLQDKAWYSIQPKVYVKRWQAKMILSLLDICIVNSFSIYKTKKSGETMHTFTQKLVKLIINTTNNIEIQ